MRKVVSAFVTDESGAVTVDWVVLTAAVLGLNMVFIFAPAREAIGGVLEQVAVTLGIVGEQMQDSNTLADG